MIIHVTDGSDPRLDPFRWRDRQLASRLDRLDAVGAGMFVAEGDLVVDRAIELRYEAIALLCDEPTGMRLADLVDESVQVFIGSEQLRGDVTGLGVPLRATGLFRRPGGAGPDPQPGPDRCVHPVGHPLFKARGRSPAALDWCETPHPRR